LKPHQSRYWLNNKRHENPEQFDQAVKTVCELYEQAPTLHEQGVHVYSCDEKTGIQALERAHPTKPMIPGKPVLIEHEYIRHGTQALIANLEVATGQCRTPSIGDTRTEADFVAHIEQTRSFGCPLPGKACWGSFRSSLRQRDRLLRLIPMSSANSSCVLPVW
jgi:hypothetical protein